MIRPQNFNKQHTGVRMPPKKDQPTVPKNDPPKPAASPKVVKQDPKSQQNQNSGSGNAQSQTPTPSGNTPQQQQQRPDFNKSGPGQGGRPNFNQQNQHNSNKFNNQNRNFQGKGPIQNKGNVQNKQPFNRGGGSKHQQNLEKNRQNQDVKMETSTEDDIIKDKKFTGRCRLFVGNLTQETTEDDFKKMFEPFGDVSEMYVNSSRSFGFIRLDYRNNAEAAKAALDGKMHNGRTLRVRFATHGAALKVSNLHLYVSNELLHDAFEQFGELERAIVVVDDRGKSTGEGIVEYVRKPGAQQALRRINEGVFLLGSSPRPVIVEPLEQKDEEDGMPEKFINKNDQYKKEREQEPRFAHPGTFEYEFGMRWRKIEELEKERFELVKKETEEARLKLEEEMQSALYDYQADQLRQDLMRQQEELRRLEEHRQQDIMRRHSEMELRQHQQDSIRKEDEQRRQKMFLMAHRLDQGATRLSSGHDDGGNQGGGIRDNQGPRGPGREGSQPLQPPPAPPVGMGIDRNRPNQMPNNSLAYGGGGMPDNKMGGGNVPMDGPGQGKPSGSPANLGGMPQNQMRPNRYDQPPHNNSEKFGPNPGNMPGGGGGGGGGPMVGGPGGGMFPNPGMGPGLGMRNDRGDDGMNRRREGGPRDNFIDMKRMRRF